MKFAVDQTHLSYYKLHGMIGFEEVLSEDSVKQLLSAIKIKPTEDGRDVWRQDPLVRSLITSRPLVEIASQLADQKILKLGYDQWIPRPQAGPYAPFFSGKGSLNDFSSFQGIVCGLLLVLDPQSERKGLFLDPMRTFFLKNYLQSDVPLLLVAYTHLKAQYIVNREDPFSPAMMRLGYSPGDRIKEHLNPTVYR